MLAQFSVTITVRSVQRPAVTCLCSNVLSTLLPAGWARSASIRPRGPCHRGMPFRSRNELRRIHRRDYFAPTERDHARAAVEALATDVDAFADREEQG